MDPLDPDFDPNKQEDDGKCEQDEPMPEEYVGQVELLDLSDDVLLCILRLCSPRDLKALGHTCPRLGALICDRTLWIRVDAREQPTGLERMRWYLEHCLSSATQELQLKGYVDRESRCLGIQDLTWQMNEPGAGGGAGMDDHCLLRMWYPYLPRYAMSPRWPDKREAAGKAYSRDKRNNSRAPLLSHLASQIVAGASSSGPSGNNNSNANNTNNSASCSNNAASGSNNMASGSNNTDAEPRNPSSINTNPKVISFDTLLNSCRRFHKDENDPMEGSSASNSGDTVSNAGDAATNSDGGTSSSGNEASNSGNASSHLGNFASNTDNDASSFGYAASQSGDSDPNSSDTALNSDNAAISSCDSNLGKSGKACSNENGLYTISCDSTALNSNNHASSMDIEATNSDIASIAKCSNMSTFHSNTIASSLDMSSKSANINASSSDIMVSNQDTVASNENTVASSKDECSKTNQADTKHDKDALKRNHKKVKTRNVATNTGKTLYRLNRAHSNRRLNAGGIEAAARANAVALNANAAASSSNEASSNSIKLASCSNEAASNSNEAASNSNEAASNSDKPASSSDEAAFNLNKPGSSSNTVYPNQNACASNGEASNASKSESNSDMAGPNMRNVAPDLITPPVSPRHGNNNGEGENLGLPRHNRRRRHNIPMGPLPQLAHMANYPIHNAAGWGGYPNMSPGDNSNAEENATEAKEVMDAIISNCPGPQFTLDQNLIRNLRSKCHNLTSLSLEYCNLDYRATNLRHFPPKLKKLSLKGTRCYNLPLNSSLLGKIQDRLPALEYLDISECEWFEPASLMSLSKLPNLEQLYMKDCRRLTECVAYASLATRYGFQKLKVLDVRGSMVADSEVSAFGWLPLLQELYVSPPEDMRRCTEHSHKWEDVLAPFTELDPWENEEPDYYRCKSPGSPEFMEEDEEVAEGSSEDRLGDVMLGNYVGCASLESRIIVIHPNRNQNDNRGYEVLRPEAVRPAAADLEPELQQEQQQAPLPEPVQVEPANHEEEYAALEAELLEPEILPEQDRASQSNLEASHIELPQDSKGKPYPGTTVEPQPGPSYEILPGPSYEDLPGPSDEDLPEFTDEAQPGSSYEVQGAITQDEAELNHESKSDSSLERIGEAGYNDNNQPGRSKRPHDNDLDLVKRPRLDKETSTTQDRQEQRARVNAIRNNIARHNQNAYIRIRNGMPIIVPPNPEHLRPLRALAFEIWRARDRHEHPLVLPVPRNPNDVPDPNQANDQARPDGAPVLENPAEPNAANQPQNNGINENVQANNEERLNNDHQNNNDRPNNGDEVNGDRQNNGVRQNNDQRPVWERFRGFHRRRLIPGFHRIAVGRPVHHAHAVRPRDQPVNGAQPNENDRPNNEDQPINGERPNNQPNNEQRRLLERLRGFHRRRIFPALVRHHGFRRVQHQNAGRNAVQQPNENEQPANGAQLNNGEEPNNDDRPNNEARPVWQRIRGFQRRGLIPAIIAPGRRWPIHHPVLINPHRPQNDGQANENPQPNEAQANNDGQQNYEIRPVLERFRGFQRHPVVIRRGEGWPAQGGNPVQQNAEQPANNDIEGVRPNDVPLNNDVVPNNEVHAIFEGFRRFAQQANPDQPNEAQPVPNEANGNQENGDGRPNEERPLRRRDYRRRMIPALVREGNMPVMHFDLEVPPRNMPHAFPLFGWYLVTDSAVLRFGRADNETINYIPIGDFQPTERGVRPDRSNLRVLSITGFRNITNRSLEHLATAAPFLRRIDFSQTGVTARGVEIFRAIRPDCEVIFSEFSQRI